MAIHQAEQVTLRRLASGQIAALRPMDQVTASAMAEILAGMEPWSRLGSRAAVLAKVMMPLPEQGARSWCLMADGEPAGTFVVRGDWMGGPYLRLLAVTPAYQRLGLSRAAMNWWEIDARNQGAKNLWLTVTDFNVVARRHYETAGFREVAVLDDLIRDGINEILMRKPLKPAAAP